MRILFAAIFGSLVLLSIVAWVIQPRPGANGKIPLTWVSDDNPARREQIGLFNQTHPHLQVMLDPNNQGLEKVIVQSLAGTGPDLFDCYGPDQLAAYVKSGVAWDITDEMRRRHINIAKDTWGVVRRTGELDGRWYGFPTNATANALWINKTLFDKAGVPYPKGPWTWAQFLPVAEKLTVRDASGKVTQFGLLLDWYQWTQFIYQWGGRIFTPDGSRCVIDSPQAIAGVQFLHDLVYKYGVVPSPAEQDMMATQGGWGSGTITLFGGGRGAMALGGRWWLISLRKYAGMRLGAVECPYGKYRVFLGGGKSTLVNRKSPRRNAALEFLVYEDSKPYNDLINHQADALGPVVRYAYEPEYLHDPDYPNDDFNAVWRDVMKYGVEDQVSPYINSQESSRILQNQLDLIKADQKPVPQALHDAAAQINAAIAKSLADDPSLRARYDKEAPLRAKPYGPMLPEPTANELVAARAARADTAGARR